MIKRKIKILFSTCCTITLGFSSLLHPLYAQNAPSNNQANETSTQQLTTTSAPATDANAPAAKLLDLHCPEINSLQLKNGVWVSGANWKSTEQSFVTKLTTFLGAQWNSQGTNIGQLICVYSVNKAQQLPTMLYLNTMAQRPLSGAWTPPASLKDTKDPYILNCNGDNLSPDSCDFSVKVAVESKLPLYQQALDLKKTAPKN